MRTNAKSEGRKPKSNSKETPKSRALGFRLLKLTNLISRPFFGQLAKKYALTLNEWRAMYVLSNSPGISSIDLSAETGLHPMNISRALSSLRRSGHVKEAPDPRDMRKSLLWLSKKGLLAVKGIAPQAKAHTEMLFSGISAEEVAVFEAVVDRLLSRAEELVNTEWGTA